MLTTLIIVSVACWIAMFFVNGFCLYAIMTLVPTILFAIRKLGIHIKCGNILACEIIFLFFSVSYRLLFHKFVIAQLLISLVIRMIFLGICLYDDTVYVYVNEERKRT